MKKLKKVLGSFAFSFLLMGVVGTSMLLSVNKSNFSPSVDAEINPIINNVMPEYWNVPVLEGAQNEIEKFGESGNENLFLVEDSSTFKLSIGTDTITRNVETTPGNFESKTNYVYIPNKNNVESGNEKEYFYFTYLNNVSLYYNIARDEAMETTGLTNLLEKAPIDNFAKRHKNGYAINQDIGSTPLGFNISFGLGSEFGFSNNSTDIDSHKVTLKDEGLYTLVVEPMVHRTTNDGFSFTSTPEKIYYSFYIFNSNVYFDSMTKIPSIKTEHVRSANVTNNLFSQYYFYNYTDDIPKFSYNKNKFQLSVRYNDIDDRTSFATVVAENNEIILRDSQGNTLENDNIFKFKYISGDDVVLYFNDLGTYEIEYSFLYTVPEVRNEDGEIISDKKQFYLPLTNLNGDTTKFKSQNQRLYIYGFQAFHTDYDNTDLETGTNSIKEFKSFTGNDQQGYNIDESADITKNLPTSISTTPRSDFWGELDTNGNLGGTFVNNLENFIINKTNNTLAFQSVKTNQPPIKFINFANVDSSHSKIFKVEEIEQKNTDGTKTKKLGFTQEAFNGFNQNDVGTYVYVLQYKFSNLVSGSGAGQSTFNNLQVLYFTIENTTPAVSVMTDENENSTEIYAKDFTNKSVVITDLSSVSAFDATVTINLTIRQTNAKGTILLDRANINTLSTSANNDIYLAKTNTGERKIYISNEGRYKNSHVTIEIYSASSNEPNVRTFTIDTTEIGKISARNVSAETSTLYTITNSPLVSPLTNQPMIFSWENKASGAQTYGYYKFFPISEIAYYNNGSLTNYLTELIQTHKMLPVNAMLDLSQNSTWTAYSNSLGNNNEIDASYVRASAGLYIFEVYDQAGNANFDVYLLDNTKPIFALKAYTKATGSTDISILSANNSLSVNEVYDYTVQWSDKKAIYVKYADDKQGFISNVQDGAYSGTDNLIERVLNSFFDDNSKAISTTSTPSNNNGISSYSSDYITVDILDDVYVKDAQDGKFKLNQPNANQGANEYYINLFKTVDGKKKENEGTHQIILRDMSNTLLSAETSYGYLNAPSAFVTINVTSDSSAMKVVYSDKKDSELTKSNFEHTGYLYENKDGDTSFNKDNDDYTLSNSLNYKLAFYTPVSLDNRQLTLSFRPIHDGAIVESIEMKYYPFVKASDTFNGTVGKKDANLGNKDNVAFFYKLSDNPTISYNVFNYDPQVSYDDTVEIAISTVGKNAEPGKYVFTRKYRVMPTSNMYDYFERQLTLIVDNFNVITSQEQVSYNKEGTTYSSAESYVGGDILLSMYSNNNQSSIEISFPNYNSEGLNQGSFYKQQNGGIPTFSVETNKLPLSLLIPEVKYTTHYSYDGQTNSYTAFNYAGLSNYGGATYEEVNDEYIVTINGVKISCKDENEAIRLVNQSAILEYQLDAKITFTASNGNSTALYQTNGSATNGYLKIFEVSAFGETISDNAQPVQFTKPGNYVVELSQASNTPDANFKKSYKFAFKIESNSPEFDILDSRNIKLDNHIEQDNKEIYFTNSKTLVIRWTETNRKYIANIDKNKISYTLYNTNGNSVGTLTTDKVVPDFTITTVETTDGKVNTFEIDLSQVWLNGSYVEITMQFEGHDINYYQTTTKRVYIDYTAPTENLGSLMQNVTNVAPYFTRAFLENNTRDLYGAQNEVFGYNNLESVSYSYTKTDNEFKNYSYLITKDYLTKLKNSLSQNTNFETKFVFLREIDLNTYTQVTKDNFSNTSSSHLNLEYTSIEFLSTGYYEIVERDMAGNMVVYIVKVIDLNEVNDNNALTFTNDLLLSLEESQQIKPLTNKEILSGTNIYSTTGLKFQTLSFLSDDWAIYTTTVNGTNEIFMTSPNLKGEIFKIAIDRNGELSFNPCALDELFKEVNSSTRKHNLQMSNRLEGTVSNVSVSIMNASLRTETGTINGDPYLRIAHPTLEQIGNESQIFPVEISIELLVNTGNKDEWQNIQTFTNPTGNPASWESTETVRLSYDSADGYLYVYASTGATNQPIRYTIIDNFGNKTIVHQKADSEDFDEITSAGHVYEMVDPLGNKTYLSSKTITLTYQQSLFNVEIEEYNKVTQKWNSVKLTESPVPNSRNLYRINFTGQDKVYRVQLVDKVESETIARTMYIKIYDKLPQFSEDNKDNYLSFRDKNLEFISLSGTQNNFRVEFEGKTFMANASVISTFSNNVLLSAYESPAKFENDNQPYHNQYGYTLHISKDDGKTWEKIENPNSYTISGVGDYIVLAKYDSTDVLTEEASIFIIQINDSSKVFYEIIVDGKKIEKADIIYTAPNGKQYDTNYMVNMRYSDKVTARPGEDNIVPNPNIIPNEELGVTYSRLENGGIIQTGTDVVVEIYHYESKASSGYFTIIYIPKSTSILNQFYYTNESGVREELIEKNSESIIVDKNKTNFSEVKLSWTSHYGIEENKIQIEIAKLYQGRYVTLKNMPIYYDKASDTNYVYLTRAGSYQIRFHDSSKPDNNFHRFGNGDYFSLIFLSSSPFVVTYTDPISQEAKTTEPINHAIYNGAVQLSLVDLNTYFTTAGYPQIHVTRNGREYTGFSLANYVYTFTEPGYYKVTFSAQDKTSSIAIREEEYVFTILNQKESTLSYEITPYKNYFIEKIEKYNADINERVDITNDLVQIIGANLINVNNKDYLTRLLLSFTDELTGQGRYIVTMNTGDMSYSPITQSSFTFMLWINSQVPPISVSIADGGSTDGVINIDFNAQSMYDTIGDCYIQIGSARFDINENTIADMSNGLSITESGTYYIQVFTQSGVLLYSYKVTKTTPLNAWAIIAIVIAVIAAVAITLITIKLRRKPKVK